MTERDVVLRFIGDTSQLTGPVDKAAKSVDNLGASGEKASTSIGKVEKSASTVGTSVPSSLQRAESSMGNLGTAGAASAAKIEASTGRAASAAKALGSDLASTASSSLGLDASLGLAGLAIGGVTLAVSSYLDKQREAKQAVIDHRNNVAALTQELDLNTLSLTASARATLDTKLANDSFDGSAKTMIEDLRQLGINAQRYRDALASPNGVDATAQLKEIGAQIAALNATGGGGSLGDAGSKIRQLYDAYGLLSSQIADAKDAQAHLLDEAALKAPEAAKAVGVSASVVSAALDDLKQHGGDLGLILEKAGLDGAQTASVLKILGNAASSSASQFFALQNAAQAAATATLTAITQSAAGFVDPLGAFSAATTFVNAPAAGGTAKPKAAPKPKLGDDPAVKAADAALKAYDRQRKALNRTADDATAAAKKFSDAESAKANAADAAAKKLQSIADASKKAAQDATDAIQKAKDKQAQENRDKADAAAIKAAIDHAALQTGDGSFAKAQQLGNKAASTEAKEAARATVDLATAQAKANTLKAKANNDAAAAAAAAKRAAQLDREATDAKNAYTKATQHAQDVQRTTTDAYQKLLDAKNAAEDIARQSTEDYASGVADAVGGIAAQVKPSFQQYLDQLNAQVQQQRDWAKNIKAISAKVPADVALGLSQLGPKATPIIQGLLTATSAQLKQFVADFRASGQAAVAGLAGGVATQLNLIAAIASKAGDKTAQAYADALNKGKITVEQALAALHGSVDQTSLAVTLGIKNPASFKKALAELLDPPDYSLQFFDAKGKPIKGGGGRLGFTPTLWDGGWINGGSGARGVDDVPLLGAKGEFMVNKGAASKWGSFLEQINAGRNPIGAGLSTATASPIYLNNQIPSAQRQFNITVVQQPGQSPHGLVAEIDRRTALAESGMGS